MYDILKIENIFKKRSVICGAGYMVEQLSGLAGLTLQILFCHYFSLSKVTDFHEKIYKKKPFYYY